MLLCPSQCSFYHDNGYLVLENHLEESAIREFESCFLGLVREWTGQEFDGVESPEFAAFLASDRDLERRLYDGVRDHPWTHELCRREELGDAVSSLLGAEIGILEKLPFRLDLPSITRELAVWHQDHFYVRGNTDTVTAWIPLQDTPYELGCLMVMPGSHKLGAIPHEQKVLGKKFIPSGVYDREIRYVEMNRGDVLLFNSLLLHSSSVNISDRGRFSLQARYSRLSQPTDPAMGQLFPLGVDVPA